MLTDKQELNKKLAVWAGFREADIKKHYYFEVGGERVAKWQEPGRYWHIKLPNFTESLDACFKWLVPKLVSGDIHIEWYTTVEDTAVELKRATTTVAFVCQPNPALAFCLAIERLIDGEIK